MSDDDAFLAAIIADPDNDMPRLVYADYLDEQGHSERAEFIRVQCELARLDLAFKRESELIAREHELLVGGHTPPAIPSSGMKQIFRRGFIEIVDTTADVILGMNRSMFQLSPISQLHIRNASERWDALASIPGIGRVRRLDLSNSETFGNNRINNFLTDAGFDHLYSLTLRNNQLWPEMLEVLAENPVLARLTSLDLSGNPVQDRGAELLASHPSFANLIRLILNSNDQRYEYCIHANGVRAITESHTLEKLQTLELNGQYVGDAGLIGMISSTLQELCYLGLAYCEIGVMGEEAFLELERNPGLPHLMTIDLRGNTLNRLAAACICRINLGSRPHLRWDLRECDMSAETWHTLKEQQDRTGCFELDAEPAN